MGQIVGPGQWYVKYIIAKYLDVFQYPDGRIEIRAGDRVLPYSIYDKLGAIDQGAIVENKRLGHVLQIVQQTQALRDSRAADVPSTAHRSNGTYIPRLKRPGTKRSASCRPPISRPRFNLTDLSRRRADGVGKQA
jgi:hypothetical protein